MNDADFIAEIHANSYDDIPRLIYADWLEEQGDPRAEYLRLECEISGLDPSDALWKELHPRLLELRAGMPEPWLAEIGRSFVPNCPESRCPRAWRRLRPTHAARIRMCDQCEQPVQFFANIHEAAHESFSGLVAIDQMVRDHQFDVARERARRQLNQDHTP